MHYVEMENKSCNLHENKQNWITMINKSSIMALKINAKYIKHKNEAWSQWIVTTKIMTLKQIKRLVDTST